MCSLVKKLCSCIECELADNIILMNEMSTKVYLKRVHFYDFVS